MKPILLFLIRLWQRTFSQVLPPTCRFYPSCSEYGYQAIARYGPIRGGWLAIKRVSRCHPFNPGGYDPVPDLRLDRAVKYHGAAEGTEGNKSSVTRNSASPR